MNPRSDTAIHAGNALRTARERLGWSQQELSERLIKAGYGGNQSAVSAWERGDILINGERALKLELVFNAACPGSLSRAVLRPDLFGDLPGLAVANVATADADASNATSEIGEAVDEAA